MKIRKLLIQNFRGIKKLDWNLPDRNIFCLIGKGDSSKSTILDAIKYVFYPQWNLSLSDSDFHQCKTDNPIVIEVSIGELIDEFCALTKFGGKYLRGWNAQNLTLSDEPDDLETVLTIRLSIGKDLEPKWRVVSDRDPDGVEFRTSDRIKVGVGMIGSYSERQLSWANGTALAKLTDTQNLNESLVNASRIARNSLDNNREGTLKSFDEAAQISQAVAKLLGVPVADKYKAHLDLNSINIKIGGLTLHDGDMPLRLLGLGSRRMLLCGIQQTGLQAGHITLFDEVEFGLEPHRIARLIKHINDDKKGQYFLTTHSPTVLRELTINELHIVHNKAGDVRILAASSKDFSELNIQGKIRSSAEAFLAKKVVICEGATEVGILRGFDDYQVSKGKDPFSYHGVALLNAGGASKIKGLSQAFNFLGYSVSVLADGDAPNHFSEINEAELISTGIDVQVWSDKLSLEKRAMMDLPWEYVLISAKLARDEFNYSVGDNVSSALNQKINGDIEHWNESPQLRAAIGQAAMSSSYFKDITKGDLWFKAIAPAFDDADFLKTDLAVKLNKLWEWAEREQ